MSSGSPVVLAIRPARELARVKTISATLALAKRGMTLATAKRAVERMVERGEAVVAVPTVEPGRGLVADLNAAGVDAAQVCALRVDIPALRERLGLTQEEFALRYNLSLRALQNWEQGREPDPVVWNYLRAIERNPKEVAEAQEVPA